MRIDSDTNVDLTWVRNERWGLGYDAAVSPINQTGEVEELIDAKNHPPDVSG